MYMHNAVSVQNLFSRTALCMLYVVNNRFISFINYSAKVILLRIFSK